MFKPNFTALRATRHPDNLTSRPDVLADGAAHAPRDRQVPSDLRELNSATKASNIPCAILLTPPKESCPVRLSVVSSEHVTVSINCSSSHKAETPRWKLTKWLDRIEAKSIKVVIFIASMVFLGSFVWSKLPRASLTEAELLPTLKVENRFGDARRAPGMLTASSLSGSFYSFEDHGLHIWEFRRDGRFLHTRIVSDSNTMAPKNLEGGYFTVQGDTLTLRPTSLDVGSGTGSIESGLGGTFQIRKMEIQYVANGAILLNGLLLVPADRSLDK
jgi:hypothetical protein